MAHLLLSSQEGRDGMMDTQGTSAVYQEENQASADRELRIPKSKGHVLCLNDFLQWSLEQRGNQMSVFLAWRLCQKSTGDSKVPLDPQGTWPEGL